MKDVDFMVGIYETDYEAQRYLKDDEHNGAYGRGYNLICLWGKTDNVSIWGKTINHEILHHILFTEFGINDSYTQETLVNLLT